MPCTPIFNGAGAIGQAVTAANDTRLASSANCANVAALMLGAASKKKALGIPPAQVQGRGLAPTRTTHNLEIWSTLTRLFWHLASPSTQGASWLQYASERTKYLGTLNGVDSRIPPHLLPSKQYGAAERLTQIDQQLRTLSPLDKEEYGPAVNAAAVPQKAAEVRPEHAPVMAQPQASRASEAQAPAKVNENVRVIHVGPTKHELALQSLRELRELRAQTPVGGWRSKAAEAMANRIVQQLQEGRDTISLSTKYAGGDQCQAASTHANAVESNKQIIDAVRHHGIAVDTGKASLATVKKAEVELGSQVGQDRTEPNLQLPCATRCRKTKKYSKKSFFHAVGGVLEI